MEFRLLGPVELWAAGRPVQLGSPMQRCVLAALAVDAGRPVMVETIIDRVWGDQPPERVRDSLYVYVARLRKLIDEADAGVPGALVRRSRSYLLDVEPDRVDAHRFRSLVDQAREPACSDPKRLTMLRQALDLWRGAALENLPGEWAAGVRTGWQQEHVTAAVEWARAHQRAGDVAPTMGTLSDLVDRYPLAESLVAALMQALLAAGQRAQAIACYERIRDRLVEQLGVDPGPELSLLYRSVLGREAAPAPPGRLTAGGVSGSGVTGSGVTGSGVTGGPAELPLDVRGFTGRDDELDRLDAIMRGAAAQPTAVVISAVSGTAGVGKTALAVHWAHRVRDRFPDGQLYVNLRGFDPAGAVMDAADAIRGFLDALAVPAHRIPAGLDAQAGLYRSLLADRRMLVLLDNARDAEQVRPLLPGTPGCLVLVTSRNELPGLVATEGAEPLRLDLLPVAEARDLLARRIGRDRVVAEPEAVEEIIAACARLPLALAIAAARTATRPDFPLSALAAELHGAGGGLDQFAGPDRATDIRAVFSCSYRTLSAGAARLFRLLGLHPGPEAATAAAASLAGRPVDEIRPLLAELTRTHLLLERAPGRYSFHDLLRCYAAELTGSHDSADERHAAVRRLVDHYLHTADTGTYQLHPTQERVSVAPCGPDVTTEDLDSHAAAMAWFTLEDPVLLTMVGLAARAGLDAQAWQLAWALDVFLWRRGRWQDQILVQEIGLAAAQRLGDRRALAVVHRDLGGAHQYAGHLDDAEAHLPRALELFQELGDDAGQALTHLDLAQLACARGRPDGELSHKMRALELYRSAGNRRGEAQTLNNLGWFHATTGDYRLAITLAEQALAVQRELGHRNGEATTLDTLGYAHHHLGRHEEAIGYYRNALDLFRELGDRYHEADTLAHLGDTHDAVGAPEAARDAWRQALAILDGLGHADAEEVRARLRPAGPGGG